MRVGQEIERHRMLGAGRHHHGAGLGDGGEGAGDRDVVAALAAAAPQRQHLLARPVIAVELRRGRHRGFGRQVVARQVGRDFGRHLGRRHARHGGVVGLGPLAEQRDLFRLGKDWRGRPRARAAVGPAAPRRLSAHRPKARRDGASGGCRPGSALLALAHDRLPLPLGMEGAARRRRGEIAEARPAAGHRQAAVAALGRGRTARARGWRARSGGDRGAAGGPRSSTAPGPGAPPWAWRWRSNSRSRQCRIRLGNGMRTGTDALAAAAEGRGVGQVARLLDADQLRRQHRADRAGIDPAIGMAADRAIDRAMVHAGAAADAAQHVLHLGAQHRRSGHCRG